MELDERLTLANAEGIDLDLVLAGIGSRTAALLLDLALQTLVTLLLGFVAEAFGDAGQAGLFVGSFLTIIAYPILSEAFLGRTLGKAALGLRVVSVDGTPVTFVGAVVRNLVRVVDALPGVYTVGLIAILASRRNQRLGDLAAGTLVVVQGRDQAPSGGQPGYERFALDPVLSPEAAGWDVSAVTAEEVSAARSFLGRRWDLQPEHRAKLAQTLAFQLLPKVSGVPLDGGPEAFLERIVSAKTSR